MAEYKDVEQLRKQTVEFKTALKQFAKNSSFLKAYISGIDDVMKAIDKLPIADVQEVKHGHFRRLTFSGDTIICSECKMAYNIFETNGAENFNFCPDCGARMDGEENGKHCSFNDVKEK